MLAIVTGASGEIGKNFIQYLLEETSCEIVAIEHNTEIIIPKSYKERIIKTNIDNALNVINNCNQEKVVIHLAFARSQNPSLLAESLLFTQKVLAFTKGCVPKINRFICISSQGVYGNMQINSKEDTPVNPQDAYGLAKYSEEMLVKATLENENIDFTNVRLASVISNAKFVRHFISKMINGEAIEVWGGKQTCSFIDARDVISALWKLVDYKGKLKHIYNLGTGQSISVQDMAEKVISIGHGRWGLAEVPVMHVEADESQRVCMDNSLFCCDFDWKPMCSVEDMIEKMFMDNMRCQNEL